MGITIIGIDCATQDKNVGLALGLFDEGEARIEEVKVGRTKGSVVETVANWITHHSPALLALDAPLGWPKGLRQALRGHKAGKPIRVGPNEMFRRGTDRFVKEEIDKTPLDVGADRIARTAHWALELLHRLRAQTGQEIHLAWKPEMISRTCAIEVYPAATLKAHKIERCQGYKLKDEHGKTARRSIVAQLEPHHVHRASNFPLLVDNADALDAVLCVLAGVDFLRGEVYKPTDLKLAKKEGWIWVLEGGGSLFRVDTPL